MLIKIQIMKLGN